MLHRIVAVDPGSEESGFVVYDPDPMFHRPVEHGIVGNYALAQILRHRGHAQQYLTDPGARREFLLIETFRPHGQPMYHQSVATAQWIGVFAEAWGLGSAFVIDRDEIKLILLGVRRGSDANIRAALIDIWGGSRQIAIGKKNAPGPLYGISSHCWAALAAAVAADVEPEYVAPFGKASPAQLEREEAKKKKQGGSSS